MLQLKPGMFCRSLTGTQYVERIFFGSVSFFGGRFKCRFTTYVRTFLRGYFRFFFVCFFLWVARGGLHLFSGRLVCQCSALHCFSSFLLRARLTTFVIPKSDAPRPHCCVQSQLCIVNSIERFFPRPDFNTNTVAATDDRSS